MPASADVHSAEDADALRVLVRFIGAVVAVVLAAGVGLLVHRTSATTDDAGAAPLGAPAPATAGPGGAGSTDPAVVALPHTLGPLAGADVGAYVQSRRAALTSAEGTHTAVVSLTSYVTEAEARSLLRGVSVRALMVAAPGGDPAVVHGSLAAWAQQTRADVEDQQHQFEQLLASQSVDDAEFVDQYRGEVARLARLRRSIDPRGRIVFGAVVVGEAAALRTLGASPSVRLVDPAPGSALPADADLRALRPEETQRAGDPATRPA